MTVIDDSLQTESAVAILAALAHPTRLGVFRQLVQAGPGGKTPSGIAEALDLAPATLSFHLKELKFAGAVHCERQGRSLVYTPDFERMAATMDFLTLNCCQGGECALTAAAGECTS